jgi:hypothetical protein
MKEALDKIDKLLEEAVQQISLPKIKNKTKTPSKINIEKLFKEMKKLQKLDSKFEYCGIIDLKSNTIQKIAKGGETSLNQCPDYIFNSIDKNHVFFHTHPFKDLSQYSPEKIRSWIKRMEIKKESLYNYQFPGLPSIKDLSTANTLRQKLKLPEIYEVIFYPWSKLPTITIFKVDDKDWDLWLYTNVKLKPEDTFTKNYLGYIK